MTDEIVTDDHANLFDQVKREDAAAYMVDAVWLRGYKYGNRQGWDDGVKNGRSTLSRGWFVLALILVGAGCFALGLGYSLELAKLTR